MSDGSRLMLTIIQPEDANGLLTELARVGCGATYLTARGGFLNRHAVAVLVMTPQPQLASVIAAIRATCSRRTAFVTPVAEAEFGYVPEPLEIEIGGAVVFCLPVGQHWHWGSAIAAVPSKNSPALPGVVIVDDGPRSNTHHDQEAAMVERDPTKLLVAIVPDRAASKIIGALVEHRYGATSVGSTGGFLRRGNTTVLTGVPASAADDAAALIQATYQSLGDAPADEGIVVFALDVEWRLRV